MTDKECVLAADIGGTHARFVCAPVNGDVDEAIDPVVLRCEGYEDADTLLTEAFAKVAGGCKVEAAALAVAGPVGDEEIPMVNLPWVLRRDACASLLGTARCTLINDFEAIAHFVATTSSQDLEPVGGGRARVGATRVVLGPGTGLGVAAVSYSADGTSPRVISGEGGNVGFAPGDALEDALCMALRGREGRAYAEQLLSGNGLRRLYGWVRAGVLDDIDSLPSAEHIVSRGIDGETDALAAIDRLLGYLGACAGDLALSFGARGGVILTGGLIDALTWRLAASPFRSRFEDKGRHEAYVSQIPTARLAPSYPGLRGALARARALLRDRGAAR
ncbi:MAG: glucokinase [Nannocystaceae bacterium]